MRQPSAGNDLKRSGVTRRKLELALRRERCPRIRTCLETLLLVVSGKSIRDAAKAAGIARSTLAGWLDRVRKHKLKAILTDSRTNNHKGRPRAPLPPNDVADAREQIAKALKRRPTWRMRRRLEAVDFVFGGGSLEDAAASAGVRPSAVRKWLNAIHHKGIAGFLEQSEGRTSSPRLDIDAAALHERAAQEWNPRIRKRMLAVAYVADGMGYYDAGVAAGLNHPAVMRWVARVRQGGISVLTRAPALKRATRFANAAEPSAIPRRDGA